MKTIRSFKRLYTDNTHYVSSDFPYMDSLAYVVQEFLYTEKASVKSDDGIFDYQLDDCIALYDFMTLVAFFIDAAANELGLATIKEYLKNISQDYYGNKDEIRYSKDNGLIVTSASIELKSDILWSSYIYAKIRAEIDSNCPKWIHAHKILWELLKSTLGLREDVFNNEPIIKNTDEAMSCFVNHLTNLGAFSKKDDPIKPDGNVVTSNNDSKEQQMANTTYDKKIAKLEATINELRQQLAEQKSEPDTKAIRIKKEFQSKMSQFLHLAWKKNMFEDENGNRVTLKEVNSAFTEFLDFDFNGWSGNLSSLYKGGNWQGLEKDIGDVIDTQESLMSFVRQASEEEHQKRNP